jgi:RNA polymerase sigma factor (sigma-70 family)
LSPVPRKSQTEQLPAELEVFANTTDAIARDAAWESLVRRHTRLLLSVARSLGGNHDDAMERYSYILEKLRDEDFRRLRSYRVGAGATFTTWLAVAARNLCLDLHRHRFGRRHNEHGDAQNETLRAVRRALDDLTEGDTPPDAIEDASSPTPDFIAIHSERDLCLKRALSLLASRDRLLVALRFEDGMPAQRIARILGYPSPFHVYRRLNTVLATLRSSLKASGIEDVTG